MADLREKIKEIVEDAYCKGDEYWGKKYGEKTYLDSIVSLFREIAKEANGQDRHNTTISDSLYDRGVEEGYNLRGSEILSNIEKVIK